MNGSFLFGRVMMNSKSGYGIIRDDRIGMDRIDIRRCGICLVDGETAKTVGIGAFDQPGSRTLVFCIYLHVERGLMGSDGIDPGHGWKKCGIAVIVIAHPVPPAVRVIIKRSAAEIHSSLYGV